MMSRIELKAGSEFRLQAAERCRRLRGKVVREPLRDFLVRLSRSLFGLSLCEWRMAVKMRISRMCPVFLRSTARSNSNSVMETATPVASQAACGGFWRECVFTERGGSGREDWDNGELACRSHFSQTILDSAGRVPLPKLAL